MEPHYMFERKYSYHVGSARRPVSSSYAVETPETLFERQVHELFHKGQRHLHNEEYGLALHAFRELQLLILRTAHPQMPVDPNETRWWALPNDISLVDILATKAAEILKVTPAPKYAFPKTIASQNSILPDIIRQELKPMDAVGFTSKRPYEAVLDRVEAGVASAALNNWDDALARYQDAMELVPEDDALTRASLLHDIAILNEKARKKTAALKAGGEALELFAAAKNADAQVHALETMVGMFSRGDKRQLAQDAAKTAGGLRAKFNVEPVVGRTGGAAGRLMVAPSAGGATSAVTEQPRIAGVARGRTAARTAQPVTEVSLTTSALNVAGAERTLLMGATYIQRSSQEKSYIIQGAESTVSIALNATAANGISRFLRTLSTSADLGLLTGYLTTPVQMIAYLPHMYFYVIPMCIGDCLTGIGNLDEAAQTYQAVLKYPFINQKVEIVKLWNRLADVYLELGERAYRAARDNVAGFAAARTHYEQIVRTNNTLNANSPLYKDAHFAGIRARVQQIIAAADPPAVNDDPQVIAKVLEARSRLGQIAAQLNFFGFGIDYVPPFSFEYLQNTARYFGQQASQIEQRYIQFKSTAENEELRREQLDQQAEVARQSVILEQRGVAESQAGVNVAQAGLNYAEVQRVNAVQSKNDFDAVRWELLELSMLEAWGSATSVHTNDQIKFNIDWTYYQSSEKPRNQVLMDLAGQRTRISHDLEAAKLQRSINAAVAYKAVAQAQLGQAQARLGVAQQRVVIAQLQQRYAEENRDFLDMKEFSAHLWYELARQARKLSQRYLDMATQIAFLMERAYNAETERGLSVIRYDYAHTPAGNLMGADFLLQDVDYFTFDYITTVRTKKIPVKKVISVADEFPMAFHLLRTGGNCVFQTEHAQFDRENPGMYLCKLQNVELLLVGLTGSMSIAGSLRNLGISTFRRADGSVVTRMYPSDVLPLSQYSVRQDALVFRFNPNELRLFENNGIETLWQLQLPVGANTFNFDELLDVQLVLYYDGFFSPTLESTITAALPANGNASRGVSLRMWYPDELFYLKSNGDAEITFDAGMFPRNQTNLLRTDVTLKLAGAAATVNNLTLRLTSVVHGAELTVVTDGNGEVNDSTAGQPLRALRNESVLDKWTLRITAADNPHLVAAGQLDLRGLQDVQLFFEYSFAYRT
jgi:hypothetical protein